MIPREMRHLRDTTIQWHPINMDVIHLHKCRDKNLILLLFYISDSPVCRCDDSLSDGTFRVTEENKEKNKDTECWDETSEEP